jgi:hypothetical protein
MTTDMLKKLRKYCKNIANRKLRFICTYDQGLSINDMESDLLEYAIKSISKKNFYNDNEFMLNYAKRSAHNRMVNIIKRNTSVKRSRIVSSHTQDREYEVRMSTLETVQHISNKKSVEYLLWKASRLGIHQEYYVRCILGIIPEFDTWVYTWYNKRIKSISLEKLSTIAKRWVGISENEVLSLIDLVN